MDGENLLRFVRMGGLLSSALLLAGAFVVAQLLSGFLNRLGNRFTDRRLVLHQTATFVRFFLLLGAIGTSVLLSFDLSDQALLALGGTLAVTVGFALKDLASSILAGLTILVEKPFQVGDRVSFAGYYGEITAIGLRSVRLVTLDDNLVTIPNNKFLTEAVASGNAGALDMLIQMDFHVGLREDVARARKIVADALTSSRYAYLKKPWKVLVNEVMTNGFHAVRLRGKVYVLDVRHEKDLETDVTERVLEGFRAAGIAAPALALEDRPAGERVARTHLAAAEG